MNFDNFSSKYIILLAAIILILTSPSSQKEMKEVLSISICCPDLSNSWIIKWKKFDFLKFDGGCFVNSARPIKQLKIILLKKVNKYFVGVLNDFSRPQHVGGYDKDKEGILALRHCQMSCPPWSYHWPEIGLTARVLINSKHHCLASSTTTTTHNSS